MYKEMKHNAEATYKDLYVSLPIDKHTLIHVEGLGEYGIVDIANIKDSFHVYALLESWTYGEEDMCVVDLTAAPILWITRDDGKKFHKQYEKKLFINRKHIVVESAYNDLQTELEDADIFYGDDELEFWSDDEINNIVPEEVLNPTIKD